MMKHIGLFFSTVLAVFSASAQNLDWVRTVGEAGTSITRDAAGNVYTSGDFSGTADFDPGPGIFNLSSNGYFDAFVSKTDAMGNFVWAVSLGGQYTDSDVAVAVDSSGNVFTAGSFGGVVDFDPGAGIFNLTAAGGLDAFIVKLDPSGNFLWAKAYGAANYDRAYALTLDAGGTVYATGSFYGTVDFDPTASMYGLTSTSTDIFVLKLDNNGNFIWAQGMGGSGSDLSYAIDVDASGNVYTAGNFNSGQADFDPGPSTYYLGAGIIQGNAFVSKLDPSGNFLWAKAFTGFAACQAYSICHDVNGGPIVSGTYQGTGTIDFDPGAGTALASSFNGSVDMFITSLDAGGNFKWAKQMGGAGDDEIRMSRIDASGAIYSAGWISGSVDMDPGAAVTTLTSNGSPDIVLSGLDSSGNFLSALNLGGSGVDYAEALVFDAQGAMLLTGGFSGSFSFDPAMPGSAVVSAGNDDVFIAKLESCSALITAQPTDQQVPVGGNAQFAVVSPGQNNTFQWQQDAGTGFVNLSNAGIYSGVNTAMLTLTGLSQGQNAYQFRCLVTAGNCSAQSNVASLTVYQYTGIQELSARAGLQVYPNPASDILHLQADQSLNGMAYRLVDQTGRLLQSGLIDNMQVISIHSLSRGLYFLQVGDPDQKPVKVIKQ